MKITQRKLKQIIREEISRALKEQDISLAEGSFERFFKSGSPADVAQGVAKSRSGDDLGARRKASWLGKDLKPLGSTAKAGHKEDIPSSEKTVRTKEAYYASEDYHCQGFPYRQTGTARACGPTGKDLFGKGARTPNAIYTRWKDLERNQTMYYITHEGKRTVATPKQVKQIRRAMARRMGIKQ